MRLSILLISFILTSCVTTNSTDPLYKKYNEFKDTTNQENILTTYKDFFSPALTKNEEADENSIPYLLFFTKMSEELRHMEKNSSEKSGCLTVQGYDNEQGDPIEFNIEYNLFDSMWYIAQTHIRFLEKDAEFSGEAKCPKDF